MFTIPSITRVQVVGRRLSDIAQPNDAVVVGLPSQITYDIRSIEPGVIISKDGMTPSDRIVAQNGTQVNIRAASFLAIGEYVVTQSGDERLYVREGIVFGECSG